MGKKLRVHPFWPSYLEQQIYCHIGDRNFPKELNGKKNRLEIKKVVIFCVLVHFYLGIYESMVNSV